MLTDFFFFNDTASTEIYTLSLHDALPISKPQCRPYFVSLFLLLWISFFFFTQARYNILDSTYIVRRFYLLVYAYDGDRKSTRLNSSHQIISYAVFCLKKKNNLILTD